MKNYLPDISLVAPLHDPTGVLAKNIRTYGKELKRFYFGYVHVRTTNKVHPDTINALHSANITFSSEKNDSSYIQMGKTYKDALKEGIKLKTRNIHVCDMDRVLHWIKKYPNELHDTVELLPSNIGLTWIGRTRRAFDTHPRTQRETEGIVNTLASEITGTNIDIMAGSFAMDFNTAKTLLKFSKKNDYSFFSEFTVIAKKKNIPINSLIVEGLEWETPDQYSDKIRKEGYQDWLDEFMSIPEWKKRIELMERNAEVLTS